MKNNIPIKILLTLPFCISLISVFLSLFRFGITIEDIIFSLLLLCVITSLLLSKGLLKNILMTISILFFLGGSYFVFSSVYIDHSISSFQIISALILYTSTFLYYILIITHQSIGNKMLNEEFETMKDF